MNFHEKTIVALDNMPIPMAEEVIGEHMNKVYGFKMNHTLFPYLGGQVSNIFCDYKLYDIPNTMCSVVEKAITQNADMITISMLNSRKSIEALSKYADHIKLLGVTYLTSWEIGDAFEVCGTSPSVMYHRSMAIMEDNGFYGMICSPQDIPTLRHSTLKKITPGIRVQSDSNDDQVRVTTPEKAIENGADYLVMGRSFFNSLT
ncbi:orotidine-5'-phosphate decarboxylase [Limnobacter sp.]|uniref:orotidine-5'-phosphate decarboxylase n=1 Tax=Limnobacter sp. TaxID=2003368 RepID=UPI00311F73B0